MSKQKTNWSLPGQSAQSADYDDSAIDYDESTQQYAGNGQDNKTPLKQRTLFSRATKQRTTFIKNPDAGANDAIFDTDRAYDVDATYDGIVVGEPHSTNKKPMAWSRA